VIVSCLVFLDIRWLEVGSISLVAMFGCVSIRACWFGVYVLFLVMDCMIANIFVSDAGRVSVVVLGALVMFVAVIFMSVVVICRRVLVGLFVCFIRFFSRVVGALIAFVCGGTLGDN